ncbi:MAG TPA: DUF6259 domain-containing protein [Bryobacteraceae bacterium]|nr:DUF6259 domain-containing protein [Bryobacteraceae bacterium]
MKFSRRSFVHAASTVPAAFAQPASTFVSSNPSNQPEGKTQLTVTSDGVIHAETPTLLAKIEKGFLTSLKSKASQEEYLVGFDTGKFDALQLVYARGETVDVGEQKFGKVETRKISDHRAEVIFQNWDGDGIMTVSVDPASGDLLIEPSAFSSRPGVRACRWRLKGLRRDLKLVAPFFQGVSLSLDDSLIRSSHWDWPHRWEAGLAILQASAGGFSVHTQDNRYRYKALHVGSEADPYMIGLDTEAYGPLDANLAAGGLTWRINVHQGDWKVPAERYRNWLWETYSLAKEEQRREPWLHSLAMAISWCPGDIAVLEGLARRVDPGKVLLHFSNWRTDAYDENYPTYIASENAAAFLARALEMGFHVMPHFNIVETDPNHPVYAQVRDFQYRDIETKKLYGWSWVNARAIGVPESNASRLNHRREKVMVKIHPGLAAWRSMLCSRIQEAARQHALREVFVDVALNTFNLHNCLVENTTSTEGVNRLVHQIADLGLSVGAEGLNETFFQGLSFAQVHLFRNPRTTMEGLERTGGCPLNHFLFGKLCRSFGYSGLGGRNADEELRARVHEENGALPTITIRSAGEITNPTPAVKRALDRAR